MLQESDISTENLPLAALSAHYCEKIMSDSQKWPSDMCYLVGSMTENSEPCPGFEVTLI